MWFPPSSITVEDWPVSDENALRHTLIDNNADDLPVSAYVKSATAYAEKYCNARFSTQAITRDCNDWRDFAALADAPIRSVTSISYIANAGETKQVAQTDFVLRKDGYEPSIEINRPSDWKPGSRITLVAVFGGDCPEDVVQAIRCMAASFHENRENHAQTQNSAFDNLLCNHRRWW